MSWRFLVHDVVAETPYPMPFLLSADAAARKIAAFIERGQSFAVIPWQMALVARILRVLPNWLHDRLFCNAPHKPRRAP